LLSAAVHGDELNGVEIITRVLDALPEPLASGTIIAAPIVNVFGFVGQSRYLPDRRDLNRSFPGSKGGSLAARIAHLFLHEVVRRCTHGIDLHTAAEDKFNLPQIRGDLTDPQTRRLAEAFGAPVMVHSNVRPGSLRGAASKSNIPVVVFEGGESQRFNESVIRIGVQGILGVLRDLGLTTRGTRRKATQSIVVGESTWIRARRGGILRLSVREGSEVAEKQVVGSVSDPFGEERVALRAPYRGLVIGVTRNPVVHGGDAVLHVGRIDAEPSEADALPG
jgi:predicted deacylase